MSAPIEALLRPPVELYTAVVAFTMATTAAYAPWALFMAPSIAWLSAAVLYYFGYREFRAGWRIVRYHRNLIRLTKYTISPAAIPISKRGIFLGLGFRWEQKHTQRMADTLEPSAKKYITPGAFFKWLRRKEQDWETKPLLNIWLRPFSKEYFITLQPVYRVLKRFPVIRRLVFLVQFIRLPNPWAPLPPVYGDPLLHGVEMEEENIYLALSERPGHTIVMGTTRVGKTRLAELLITQDIARNDGPVIIFDPKGDADLLKRAYAEAKRHGREKDFIFFHLGYPELSARYNPVGRYSRITEVPTRVANQLPGEGNSAAFKEFAWRFLNIVSRARQAEGERVNFNTIAGDMLNIEPLFIRYATRHLSNSENTPPNWAERVTQIAADLQKSPFNKNSNRSFHALALANYMREAQIVDPVLDGLRSAVEYDKTYFDKLVASLLPFLEKLTTGKTAELISPDYLDFTDERPIIDWPSIVKKNAIVYIGLDAMSDPTVSVAVGSAMFADLVSYSGYLYKHGMFDGMPGYENKIVMPKINLHMDEFNELITPTETVQMLNKAGGSGVQITAYTQVWSDIEAKTGSKPKASQITGNFNNVIMLRVKDMDTAELLTKQVREVRVHSITEVSGVNDSADPESDIHFTSKNEDRISQERVPMITPDSVMQLPKGQAFALIHGGHLYKIRMPLPSSDNDPMMPGHLSDIAGDMSAKYHTQLTGWADRYDNEFITQMHNSFDNSLSVANDLELSLTQPVASDAARV